MNQWDSGIKKLRTEKKLECNKQKFRLTCELLLLVPLYLSSVQSTRYADRQNDFAVSVQSYCKAVFGNSFFPRIVRLLEFPD